MLRLVQCSLLAGVCALPLLAQTPTGNPPEFALKDQDYQRPEACLPCHQRQYDELRLSVKSGYRPISPLMNALELAGNFLSGGRLRPVYKDSTKIAVDGTPLTSNFVSTKVFTNVNQVQAALCVGCHNIHRILEGDDPSKREIPELNGVANNFRPDLVRPLRDYALVDSGGRQVLPAEIGGPPPPGSGPSVGAAGISCDVCHNAFGPDLNRSFQHDGYADAAIQLFPTIDKVGPFNFPVAVKGNFHVASRDQDRIAYLRSPAFCNACHDVRLPGGGSLWQEEHNINPGGENVRVLRLENLGSEWQTGAYNTTSNPFGKVIRCQDCHMSLFPYGGDSTYQVGDVKITSPTPGVFPLNYAAVPGVSTDLNYPLQKRPVVTHYLTGVDVPLLSEEELHARLGPSYPEVSQPGSDEYGTPKSLQTRREDLLKASVRINLNKTDSTAKLGQPFTVRVEAVALTGHRFPSGFSQERTAYIQLTVTDDNGFVVYQSGYVVDKPHPDTGEMQPDGNLNDEDPEHVHVVVDPGQHTDVYKTGVGTNGHTNQVFELGPDNGPEERLFSGAHTGLVLFRNELTRIFMPGDTLGRKDANGNNIVVDRPHFEETFSAGFANAVDNYRSIEPLQPHMYAYDVTLPTQEDLRMLGMDKLQGPLHVHAQVNFEHFPPLFIRFLARTTGPDGPAGHSFHLIDEKMLDTLLKNNTDIASADVNVELGQ